MQKGGDSPEILIIKEPDEAIPWQILNKKQKRDILLFDLQDVIYKEQNYIYTVDNITDLLDDIQLNDIYEKALKRPISSDTLNILFNINWLIPVTSDVRLILGQQKDIKNSKIITLEDFKQKLTSTPPTANLVNVIKPYELIYNPDAIKVKSHIGRIGINEFNVESFIEGKVTLINPNINRIFVKNEIVNILGFVVDYSKLLTVNLILSNGDNIYLKQQLFPREYPLPFNETKRYYNLNDNAIIRDIKFYQDLFAIYTNSTNFELTKLEEYAAKLKEINDIQAYIPEIEIKETAIKFPAWGIEHFMIVINSIYGQYLSLNTNSDLIVQRETWIAKNYFSSIPYYILLSLLELLSIADISVLRRKITELNKEYELSYQFIEDIIENEKKHDSIYRKINELCSKNKDITSVACENKDIIEYRLKLINTLFDRLDKFISKNKLHLKFKQLNNENYIQRKEREIVYDIYSQAIFEQLTPAILYKKQKLANRLMIPLNKVLDDQEQEIVKRYIENIIKHRQEWKNNKCPHFAMRKNYSEAVDYSQKFAIFEEMIKIFGSNAPDPETKRILCNNCGFNLCCEHEKLLLEQYNNKEKANSIEYELEDNYYSKDFTDPNVSFIYCRFCGRKIREIPLSQYLQFDDDNKPVFGNVIERDDPASVELRNFISSVLVHTSLQGNIDIFNLYKKISNHIFREYENINTMNISTEEQILLKKTQTYAYVYAAIIESIISNDFRYNFRKEIRGIDYKKSKTDIKPLVLAALRTIRKFDIIYFNQIQIKQIKLPVAISRAYKILRQEIFNKKENVSQFDRHFTRVTELIKLYVIKEKTLSLEQIYENIETIGLHKVLLSFNKILDEKLSYFIQLSKSSLDNLAWAFLDENNELFNYIYDKIMSENRVGSRYNRKIFSQSILPMLDPRNIDRSEFYNYNNYCSDGTKQVWNLTKLINKETNAKITIDSKKLKQKLTLQKDIYNYGGSLANIDSYAKIGDDINVINIGYWNQEKENTKCNEMTKSEAKNKSLTMTIEEKNKIHKKAIDLEENQKLQILIIRACGSSALGEKVCFGSYCINCGFLEEPIDTIVTKVKKQWNIRLKKTEIAKAVPKYTLLNREIDEKYKELTKIDKQKLNKIITKLNITENIADIILDMGLFDKQFQEELENIKVKIEGPEEEKRISKKQKFSRALTIIKYIKRLYTDYFTIKTNSSTILINEPGQKYLKPFIEKKMPNDFDEKLPYINIYDEILYATNFSSNKKVSILLNLLINILDTITKTKLSKEFIVEFLSIVQQEKDILDISQQDINAIDQYIDLEKRKRISRFERSTPEEKIIQGLMLADFREQQALFEGFDAIQSAIDDEIQIEEYNETIEAQHLTEQEDFESQTDNDIVFNSDAFDFI